MKKRFITVSEVDQEVEKVSRRIATAITVDITDTADKQNILSDVAFLKCQIRDLQRQNLCLEFLVEHPDFNFDEKLSQELSYIEKSLYNNIVAESLINKYGYTYMLDNYHPDFILGVCRALVEAALDRRCEYPTLWSDLIMTCGLITKTITDNYGPVETDKGIL